MCQQYNYASCLVKLSEWIDENEELFNLLLKNIKEKNKLRYYKSELDFILCEMLPEYKPLCKKFYAGRGKPLDEILTEKQIGILDKQITITVKKLVGKLST